MVSTDTFSIAEQAEYSLVSNLIGLVCKYIFQPAEESAYMAFSFSTSSDQKKSVDEAIDNLRRYLQAMTAIGTGGYIFAKMCGKYFILIVYTEKWANESCE